MFNPNTVSTVSSAQLIAQIGVVNYLLTPFAAVLSYDATVGQILAADRTANASLTLLGKAMQQLEVMECPKASKATIKAMKKALDQATDVICEYKEECSHAEYVAGI